MSKSDSLANAVVIGFLDGIFTGMFKKKRKRNCLYSYQYKTKGKRRWR